MALQRKAEDLLERARLRHCRSGAKARFFDDVYYRAQSWKEPRRVVLKCEWLEPGSNRRFVVTNRGEEAQALKRRAGFKARRWVAERTHSWLNRYRAVLIRWEKKAANHIALLHLAFALITYRAAGLSG